MTISGAGAAFVGLIVGTLLFSRVGHLLVALREIYRESGDENKLARLALAAGLSSGLWLLVVAVSLSYYLRNEPWAAWLYGGTLFAIAAFGMIGVALAGGKLPPRIPMPRALDPWRAEYSDKPTVLRTHGVLFAILNVVVLSFVFPHSWDLGLVIITSIASYFGGWLMGWFIWGLVFEPAIGMRHDRKVMPNNMPHPDARNSDSATPSSSPRAPSEHGH